MPRSLIFRQKPSHRLLGFARDGVIFAVLALPLGYTSVHLRDGLLYGVGIHFIPELQLANVLLRFTLPSGNGADFPAQF